MTEIDLLAQTRKNALSICDGYSVEQLNVIPQKFNNNIIWNLGHMLVTQQLLCYNLAYKEVKVPNSFVAKYRKGTRPSGIIGSDEISEIKKLLMSSISLLRKNLADNYFESYKPYETSYGVYVTNMEDAIQFNNLHEAMHLGTILSLSKLV